MIREKCTVVGVSGLRKQMFPGSGDLFVATQEEKAEAERPCPDLHEFGNWEELCTAVLTSTVW